MVAFSSNDKDGLQVMKLDRNLLRDKLLFGDLDTVFSCPHRRFCQLILHCLKLFEVFYVVSGPQPDFQ